MSVELSIAADSFSKYLSEIREYPVLSEQEEHRLAVRLFEDNDLDAARALITSNLRFVVKIANEYRSYGIKMLDLIQEGNIGLMLAVRRFNPYRGLRLITYAVWWIRAQIQSFIISSWSLLKIGTTQAQRKLFFKLKQAQNAIRQMADGDVASDMTAKSLNVSEAEVEQMEMRLMGEVSLDAELSDGESATLIDTLADDRPNQEAQLVELQEQQRLRMLAADAMSELSEKEQYVVRSRIVADDPQTLQEIADYFSVSRERVRQIEENAIKKVRAFFLKQRAIEAV